MTNKYKILYILSFTVLVATGCSKKFLEDMKSFDKYDESLFTNETQTGWYIDKMYNDYFAAFNSPSKSIVGLYSDNRSRMTEEIGGGIDDRTNPQKTLINATDADNYYGTGITTGVVNNPYTRIRNCNFLLAKIDEVGSALSEQFRDRARGQSYFLRALQYYDLVRVYGGVPIVTTVQSAVANDPATQIPRATTSECITQIIKDLDSAARLLPLKWDATNWGRMSGAAALAMKSRVLLTFASPLFNTDWDNQGNARWQAALQAGLAAETALEGAGYGLYGTSAKDWGNMWSATDNVFNKEAIIVQLFSNSTAASGIISNGWEKSIRPASQTGGGGISVPKAMIDLFPMKDGSRPKIGVNYNDTLFFVDRDPRFYRTFVFSGCKWGTKDNNLSEVFWDYNWMYKGGTGYADNNSTLNSPVLVRKMSNPAGSSPSAGLQFSGTDIFEYRYAELLLNIAECYAATGDIGNCVAYLGKIRTRIGIPQGANNWGIGTPSSKYAAIEAVLYERRVELAYEGKRFWDTQRWKLYADDATAGNTVTKLGLTPINGTARTGYYWQYKDTLADNKAPDPLLTTRTAFSIDPDASDFTTQLNNLVTYFHTNLKAVPLPTGQAMDRINTTPVTINFRPNYYLSGLHQTTLSTNQWLKQTIGWNDQNGAMGTYDYKQ